MTMLPQDRADDLIQKKLEGLATEAELGELELLLAADSQVALDFAEATRLHASLAAHFQKQYKIDQISQLLNEADPSHAATEANAGDRAGEPAHPAAPAGSTFVPRRGLAEEPRRNSPARRPNPLTPIAGRANWIVAALLVLAAGAAVWFSGGKGDSEEPQLISGIVTVSGNAVRTVPVGALFEVTGREEAVIGLPGGAHLELAATSKAAILRDGQKIVVQLVAGKGQFFAPADQPALRIETPLGSVSAADSRFTLELTTTTTQEILTTESRRSPQLFVTVASGSVTFDRGGVKLTVNAGEEQVFF
ncbi:MAG: FecR domain-containing protein [Planctomycetia bacterium]|nr:FecR domain-containing protein [Planctomycetia bacterium]